MLKKLFFMCNFVFILYSISGCGYQSIQYGDKIKLINGAKEVHCILETAKGCSTKGLLEKEEIEKSCREKEKGDKALSKEETEFCIPEVKAYTYPQQFVLGPNLNAAITELAIMYDEFDSNRIKEEDYKESIIFRYCKNSRQTFDYLEQLKEEYNGVIPREQVEYIQYSLTGEWVDFKDEIPKEGLNIIQSSSGFCDGKIKSYQADCVGDEVNLLAEFEIVEDGTQITYLYELNIVLVKNPESCFDGYSIKSLSSKDITKPVYGDNKEHTFRGVGSEWEDNGVFEFENYGGKDDVVYDRYIRIN